MAKEKNLTAVTSVAAADFARVVTSAGASVKATFANIAKYIVETYNGSTVAGSAQSVKSALDSLNSKTSNVTSGTLSWNTTNVNGDANRRNYYKLGKLVIVSCEFTPLSGRIASGNVIATGLPQVVSGASARMFVFGGDKQQMAVDGTSLVWYFPLDTTTLTRIDVMFTYFSEN